MKNQLQYNIMPDGTVKQMNPFFDYEVWSVPGWASKPRSSGSKSQAEPVIPERPESVCSFCEARYFETPPERARVVRTNGGWSILRHLHPKEYFNSPAEFRRVGNLFEMVTIDYWRKNYNFRLTPGQKAWKDEYLSAPEGIDHIRKILSYKLSVTGKTEAEIESLSDSDIIGLSEGFFGGGHELVIARPHYTAGAKYQNDLFSSGDMDREEHEWYLRMTIDGMEEIIEDNRYVRYVCAFQNWLHAANTTFNHLHKQLVALDDWGALIDRKTAMRRENENIFNEWGANYALQHNLVFLENDHALAYTGIGHRFPTVEVYSKSENTRPYEHTEEEIRGVSDLVHAIHAATGNKISTTEEWFYTPVDSIATIPWHIHITWRINVRAGFEGGTNIFINPVTPVELRDRLVPRLYALRDAGKIGNVRIAEECGVQLNPLLYYIR
jgi:galactose-1-phosphate uridylyltransferase